jgi:hypothetical protein
MGLAALAGSPNPAGGCFFATNARARVRNVKVSYVSCARDDSQVRPLPLWLSQLNAPPQLGSC